MKEQKGRKDFISKVKLYNRDGQIAKFEELEDNEFSGLLNEYDKKIESFEENYEQFVEQKKISGLLEEFRQGIKDFFQGIETAMGSLNVLMTDSKDQPIARTTIELDADIITLLREDIAVLKNKERILKIQGLNVMFVNKFFKIYLLSLLPRVRRVVRVVKTTFLGVGSFGTFLQFFEKTCPYLEGTEECSYNIPLLVQGLETWLMDRPEFLQSIEGLLKDQVFPQIIIPVVTFLAYRYGGKIAMFFLQILLKNK